MKKKLTCYGYLPYAKQILRKMKLTVLLLTIAILSGYATDSYSQSARLTLSIENSTIGSALKAIEDQSEFRFFYSGEVDVESSASVSVIDKNVMETLDELFRGTGIRYEIYGRQVALLAKQETSLPTGVQQTGVVTGKVTDRSGAPLPGATVVIKGTTTGTVTDVNGNYSLSNVPSDATLVFSFVGMRPNEVSVDNKTLINVVMEEETIGLEEVIAVGYRTQLRGSVTGSVSSVNSADFKDFPIDNLSNALSGRLSGVTITQVAGTPGMESNIQVRAVGTFNNQHPLYVIDGIVSDKFAFDGLSTMEVESISILKDGAAASIYGSRAANGVILVTTKRGARNQEPRMSYSSTYGVQSPTRIPASLNALEHAETINNALRYNNVPITDRRYFTPDELEYFSNNSWDWVEELWNEPITTQHSFNVNGGTNNVRYFLGGSYIYATGSFENIDYRKLNLRTNVDVDITNNLTASLDLSTDNRWTRGPNWETGNWRQEDLYKALVLRTSMVPPYINGIPVGNYVEWHPGEVINLNAGYNNNEFTSLNATLGLQYKVPFVPGLSLKTTYNRYKLDSYRKQFNLPYNMTFFNWLGEHGHIVGDIPTGPRPRPTTDFLYQRHEKDFNYQLNFQIDYRRNFGEHDINASFIYEQREEDTNWFDGRVENFITFSIDQIIAGSTAREASAVSGRQSQSARLSYIGLVDYNYADKYLVQGSFRYDGSVIFSPENRWGFFPSGSLGWRISNEPFFKIDFFDDLKFRVSAGLLGNDAVGAYQWLQSYRFATGAIWSSATNGLEMGSLVNRDITWEKAASFNIGIDSRFWNNKLAMNLDMFYRHTYDILGDKMESIPSTFGAILPDENYQVIDAKGFEVELGYNNRFSLGNSSTINYYIRGNFGLATNEVIVMDEAENIRPHQSRLGRPVSGHFAYIADGIIRTQDELDALPIGYTIEGVPPRLGMLNYVDLRGPNSDEPDGRITTDDRAWIGDYTRPPINYGLSLGGSWESFNVDVLFQGVAGHQVMMHENGRDVQARPEESSYAYWADSWTPENPDGKYPGFRGTGFRTRFPVSSFWLRDGSFLRLKNLNVSYTLPQNFIDKINIESARVFFTGTNLALLFDKIGDWGYDPEMNNIRAYPMMKTYSLGVNMNF
jgi:TonB-linked SusC/RagA family outer membrane protein